MSKKITTEERSEKVKMPCLECGKIYEFDEDSNEADGVFNVFCSKKDCEDLYASKQ